MAMSPHYTKIAAGRNVWQVVALRTAITITGLFLVAQTLVEGAVEYPSRPPSPGKLGTMHYHDPTGIKVGSDYYVYGTHGAPTHKSSDLITWRLTGFAIPNVPPAAKLHVPKGHKVWAPDILRVGRTYRLYYCYSQFGTRNSCIGFVESASPAGPFRERGLVFKTLNTDRDTSTNALDPNVFIDTRGKHWMAYGSYFGGLCIMELSPRTGKPLKAGQGKILALRAPRSGGIEAPHIIYHPGFRRYYLFVSYGQLATTYNVRVGRSTKPDGPYLDHRGKKMADRNDDGLKILNSYAFSGSPGWMGPGHNGIIRDGRDYYMVHHARDAKKVPWLHVRKILWTNAGWPIVSPQRYAGEKLQPVPPSLIPGRWEQIVLEPKDNRKQVAKPLKLLPGGDIAGGGRWRFTRPAALRLAWSKTRLCIVKLLPAWDWENDRATLVYTGLSLSGKAVWGKRIGEK